MYILINALYIIAGIIWGNLRNWKRYYPSILYLIIGDLLYNFYFIKNRCGFSTT